MRSTIPLCAVAFALVLVGCGKTEPVVVLDSWWSVDYAKNFCGQAERFRQDDAAAVSAFGCARVTRCLEYKPVLDACAFDPSGGVHDFENELVTQFALSAECRSVKLVRFDGPSQGGKVINDAASSPNFSLSIDYAPGASRQSWKMIHSPDQSGYTQGTGDAKEIAKNVCTLAKGLGAKIAN